MSHDKVKLALGLFCGFVFAIASPLYGFLYLTKNTLLNKKVPYFLHLTYLLHLQQLKSQY